MCYKIGTLYAYKIMVLYVLETEHPDYHFISYALLFCFSLIQAKGGEAMNFKYLRFSNF